MIGVALGFRLAVLRVVIPREMIAPRECVAIAFALGVGILGWCVFFLGATYVHMADYHARGASLHSHMHIVLAHAVVPALMIGLGIWLWARWRGARSLAD